MGPLALPVRSAHCQPVRAPGSPRRMPPGCGRVSGVGHRRPRWHRWSTAGLPQPVRACRRMSAGCRRTGKPSAEAARGAAASDVAAAAPANPMKAPDGSKASALPQTPASATKSSAAQGPGSAGQSAGQRGRRVFRPRQAVRGRPWPARPRSLRAGARGEPGRPPQRRPQAEQGPAAKAAAQGAVPARQVRPAARKRSAPGADPARRRATHRAPRLPPEETAAGVVCRTSSGAPAKGPPRRRKIPGRAPKLAGRPPAVNKK